MSVNAVAIGLKNMYMGAIASDGGMGTSLELVAYAIEGTPTLNFEEGDKTDFNIEQSNDPYYSITNPGNKVLTLSIYGVSPALMYKYFGGTLVIGATSANPDVWSAPATFPDLEKSIVLTHNQGGHLKIARGKISALVVWNFQKAALPQIDLTITILTPTKTAEPPMVFSEATYP